MATRMKKNLADQGKEDESQVEVETLPESLDYELETTPAAAEESPVEQENPSEAVVPTEKENSSEPATLAEQNLAPKLVESTEEKSSVPAVELSSGVDSAGFPISPEPSADT